ncbi:MAG TPA: M28 family peptidase, partial [Cyclobacteriaceae bacterium]|nr:M28 family peptidase [Cyclobacteriaceae bacterium]
PADMKLKADHNKVSGYFNIDNGTGRIRGIYLQGNDAIRPIFEKWFTPFSDMIDNTTVTIQNTGGTDHLAFDAVGIPGFQFIQDPIEYDTRTHHTNVDTYERLMIDDLKQMAVIVATFVYNTAQRQEKLPRKPLPEPQGPSQF